MRAERNEKISGVNIIDEDTSAIYECAEVPSAEIDHCEEWTSDECQWFLRRGWVTNII